jgi:hypothetical protein
MPAQVAIAANDAEALNENRFSLPGWIAIVQAIILPLSIGLGIVESVVSKKAFGYSGPVIGPSDLLGIAFTVMAVYTLTMFRKLLKEHYNFDGIDTLLVLSIWWVVAFQILGIVLSVFYMVAQPIPDIVSVVVFGVYVSISMVTIGTIDILIGIRLLRDKEQFSELLRAFAYVSLVAGILEVSILLSLLAVLLVPVSLVIMGLIFLRDKQDVQFV